MNNVIQFPRKPTIQRWTPPDFTEELERELFDIFRRVDALAARNAELMAQVEKLEKSVS